MTAAIHVENLRKSFRVRERASGLRAERGRSCQGREAAGSPAAGASSRITWALVPPTPKELTPARRGAPSGCQGARAVLT